MTFNFIKNLTLRNKIFVIGILILLLASALALFRVITNTAPIVPEEPSIPSVTLLPLSSLSKADNSLLLTGTLRSKSEADLRTEVPGRITGVYAKVGNWVKSGALIAEVENSAQKAQVTQALGALQAAKAQVSSAKAQLQKVENGASQDDKNIVASQVSAAKAGLTSAQDAARNALQGAYAGTVSVTSFGSDTMMHDAISVNPTLSFQTTEYAAKIHAENMRVAIGDILARHDAQSAYTIATENIVPELQKTKAELISLRKFTDVLLTALSGAIITTNISNTTINTYTTTISTVRAQILNNINSLTGAESAISTADKALRTVQENENKVLGDVRTEDQDFARATVSTTNASVTSALGSYQAALALLEKTRIRATISGTLSSFSARRGDFVGTQALGRIVGPGGTEVIFNIPSTDRARISIGDEVLVSQSIKGTVTSISNSTDALSQQLEVRADLINKPNNPNGSVVSVKLLTKKSTLKKTAIKNIPVPINAVKFTAQETFMFGITTIDTITTLTALPVTLGDVRGNMVLVSGVQPDTEVVTDARGLTAGQVVIVK